MVDETPLADAAAQGSLWRLSGRITPELSSGLIYMLGDFIVLGSRFVLALVYAAFMNTAEYGILAVAMTIYTVAGILFTFGLKGSAFKQNFDYPTIEEKREFYGTIWLFLVLVAGALILVLDVIWQNLPVELFQSVRYDPYIRLALWSSYLQGAFGVIIYEVLRANRRPGFYISLAIGNTLTLVFFGVTIVGVFQQGVQGALAALLLTGLVWAFLYTLPMLRYSNLRFNFSMMKRALVYGLPLLPHYLAHWLLNFSDRIILEANAGLSQLGIYSLGYNVGAAQYVVVNSGISALMPNFGAARKDESNLLRLTRLFSNYILLVGLIGLALAVFADDAIRLFFPDQYFAAGDIVYWVVLGFFFVGLYYGPMHVLTLIVGDTRKIWIFTLIGAIVNVTANLWLVPRFGITAAAVNTLIGYFVLFLLVFWYSQRQYRFQYEYSRLALVFGALVTGIVVDRLINPSAIWAEIVIDVFIVLFFALIAVPGLRKELLAGEIGLKRE